MSLELKVKEAIRDVKDFPIEGIVFKDITPIFQNYQLTQEVVDYMKIQLKDLKIDGIAGIESRGFLIGPSIAMALKVPFIMIRKKGKLPYKTVSYKYDLEYGTAEIEMHIDAIEEGQNILIHDDLLATGGSASAAAELIQMQGGHVAGFNFLVDLSFLNGVQRIKKYSENISNLVSY